MPRGRSLKDLGTAFAQFVQFGDHNQDLWPFLSKPALQALFSSLLSGTPEFYHKFLDEPVDPTQDFLDETTIKDDFVWHALRLRETGFVPSFLADPQVWDHDAVVFIFPASPIPFRIDFKETPGVIVIDPTADFNARFTFTFPTSVRRFSQHFTVTPDVEPFLTIPPP